jgi:hypothetical protein
MAALVFLVTMVVPGLGGVDVDLAQDPPVASIPPGKVTKVKRYLREVLDAKPGASKDLQF